MELLPAIRDLFEHNYWARDRQLQVCATFSEDRFLREVGGSFPSVRDTLVHLVAVEWLWLERWRGKTPKTLISRNELPTLASIEKRWREVEQEMRTYVDSLDENKLAATMTYLNTRGQVWTYPLWQAIMHLLNHQNYHRGQITSQVRMLGLQPAPVDYLWGKDMKFKL